MGSSKPAVLPISLKLQATGDLSPVAGQRIGFKVLVVQPSMLEWYAWDDVPSAAGSGATPTGAGWFVMVWRWRTSQQLPPLSHRGKFLWESNGTVRLCIQAPGRVGRALGGLLPTHEAVRACRCAGSISRFRAQKK